MIKILYKDSKYWVIPNNGSAVPYDRGERGICGYDQGYYSALSLCRLRLNKCRTHEFDKDKLIVIKVPFVKLWLVW